MTIEEIAKLVEDNGWETEAVVALRHLNHLRLRQDTDHLQDLMGGVPDGHNWILAREKPRGDADAPGYGCLMMRDADNQVIAEGHSATPDGAFIGALIRAFGRSM